MPLVSRRYSTRAWLRPSLGVVRGSDPRKAQCAVQCVVCAHHSVQHPLSYCALFCKTWFLHKRFRDRSVSGPVKYMLSRSAFKGKIGLGESPIADVPPYGFHGGRPMPVSAPQTWRTPSMIFLQLFMLPACFPSRSRRAPPSPQVLTSSAKILRITFKLFDSPPPSSQRPPLRRRKF